MFRPLLDVPTLTRYWLLNRRSDCRVCLPPPELKGSRGTGQGSSVRRVSGDLFFSIFCRIGWPMTNWFLNSSYYPHIQPKIDWIWSIGMIVMRLVSLSLSPMAPWILWNYTPVISSGGAGVGVFGGWELRGFHIKILLYLNYIIDNFRFWFLKRISTHDPFYHKNWYYLFHGRLHSINYFLLQQMRGGLNQWLLPLQSKIPWCCLPLSPETQVVVFMRKGRIPLSRVQTGFLSS